MPTQTRLHCGRPEIGVLEFKSLNESTSGDHAAYCDLGLEGVTRTKISRKTGIHVGGTLLKESVEVVGFNDRFNGALGRLVVQLFSELEVNLYAEFISPTDLNVSNKRLESIKLHTQLEGCAYREIVDNRHGPLVTDQLIIDVYLSRGRVYADCQDGAGG